MAGGPSGGAAGGVGCELKEVCAAASAQVTSSGFIRQSVSSQRRSRKAAADCTKEVCTAVIVGEIDVVTACFAVAKDTLRYLRVLTSRLPLYSSNVNRLPAPKFHGVSSRATPGASVPFWSNAWTA